MTSRKPETSKKWEEVFAAERRAISNSDEEADKLEIAGLALSGGGIRSAAFALGVVQALTKFKCVERFHYLSTVSGGGYTGVAISWLRKLFEKEWHLQLRGTGTRPVPRDDEARDGKWLDFLRQHGNYLQPAKIGAAALAIVALRNLILSLAVYVGFAAILLATLHFLQMYVLDPHTTPYWTRPIEVFGVETNPHIRRDVWGICAIFFAILMFVFVMYSLGSFAASFESWGDPLWALILVTVPIAMIAVGTRPQVAGWDWGSRDLTSALLVAGGITLLVAVAFFICRVARYIENRKKNGQPDVGDPDLYRIRVKSQKLSGFLFIALLVLLLAALLPEVAAALSAKPAATLLALIASAGTAYHAVVAGRKVIPKPIFSRIAILVAFVAVVMSGALTAYFLSLRLSMSMDRFLIFCSLILVVSVCTNLNQFGIGRMYRDRLMETFMPDKESILATRWYLARTANTEQGLLKSLWPTEALPRSLYPLINTNVVLTDSRNDTFRGRGGDSFVLSPMFCGSDATGWVPTEDFGDRDFKTGTAMALSGAAANPNTAPGGHGFGRNRLVSFLMFLAQVRLGGWIKNPREKNALKTWLWGQRPNFLHPGLTSGLFGWNLTERAYFLELTDGGHFDNTGAYELIRRKARLIVLSQASQDSDFWLADLANLVEKIRVDFNVRIYFGQGMPIQGVLPKQLSEDLRVKLAARGHAIAQIRYYRKDSDDYDVGWLVYLQATPLNALAVDVHSYHMHNRSFPNEPTANQFFREAQLEVYRELGYAITKRFLREVVQSRGASSGDPHDVCLQEVDRFLRPQHHQVGPPLPKETAPQWKRV